MAKDPTPPTTPGPRPKPPASTETGVAAAACDPEAGAAAEAGTPADRATAEAGTPADVDAQAEAGGAAGRVRYAEIAGELRGWIEGGVLRPGDRVPSTREITRRWGVAMATATKVLTELRTQGLVHTVPGSGTRVAPHPGPTPPPAVPPGPPPPGAPTGDGPRGGVGVEEVVRAALGVADAEGLGAVSMRRVAGDLGVATMTLYRHVADKDDLLTRMLDAAFAEEPLPDDAPGGWRPRLELAAGRLWRLFRRHPWAASAMSLTRPQPIPHAIPYTEWTLATLQDHGLDRDTAFTAHITLFNYVRGTAINLETEAEAEAVTGLDSEQWLDTQGPALRAIIDSGDFPRLRTLTEREYDFDLDRIFTFGLHRYLDGLAPLLPT